MSHRKFYSNRNIMSFDRNIYIWRFIIGVRGGGKTFQSGNLLANLYHKVKFTDESPLNIDDQFIYYRLKPQQVQNMEDDILDPKLQRKHNIKIKVEGNKIYFNNRHMGHVLALQQAPFHKGTPWHYRRYRFGIIDEFQLERKERRTFDIIYNLRSSLESVFRFTTRLKEGLNMPTIILTGNTVDEATDLLYAFDFLPTKYGVYKLKSKNAIIEYFEDTKEYQKLADVNPLRVLNVGDDFTFGEIMLKNRHNIIDPGLVGHRKFLGFLQLTAYVVLEMWSTQKGYLYFSKGLPTKKWDKITYVLHKSLSNKGTVYSVDIHKLVRKHYNEDNIYFDKRITAQVFEQNVI